MSGSIKLSAKHGVNPSIMQCYLCLKDFGVALFGRLPGDGEAPRQYCRPGWECDECKKWKEQGVILISVRNGEAGKNPYRTGGWVVIKTEAFDKVFNGGVPENRVAFVDDETWDKVGLPRENSDESRI